MSEPMLMSFIKNEIATHGPMDVGTYMTHALCHPEFGYYMRRDPFGVDGDFITAPEVSQMFGELIGAWAADIWMQMGQPSRFALVECGPGRGTLMADALRAVKGVEGFVEAAELHLIEASPYLKVAQTETLESYSPVWHDDLSSVPSNMPIILIANEFLDALPVQQLEYTAQGWRLRKVSDEDGLCFTLHEADDLTDMVPAFLQNAKVGEVLEISPARTKFMSDLCARFEKQSGAALFVDYGPVRSELHDSLHAIKGHEHVDVFSQPGQVDVSANVDFEIIANTVVQAGVALHGPIAQGSFLEALGVGARSEYLKTRSQSAEEKKDIEKALHRLTHSDEMGTLFKALGVSYDARTGTGFKPAGF